MSQDSVALVSTHLSVWRLRTLVISSEALMSHRALPGPQPGPHLPLRPQAWRELSTQVVKHESGAQRRTGTHWLTNLA
jgi:hypothetical protein